LSEKPVLILRRHSKASINSHVLACVILWQFYYENNHPTLLDFNRLYAFPHVNFP